MQNISLKNIRPFIATILLSAALLTSSFIVSAQKNLLLNGDFEDINTCSEYNSECGVEAWFYLRDVKAQMFSNEEGIPSLGNNSFAIFFPWNSYTGFSPVIGTLLPCRLQKGVRYSFKGLIEAKLNNRLTLQPGVVLNEKFYVPRRPFSASMQADTITQLQAVPKTNFFQFEFDFVATGLEKYLTFGTFIREDTVGAKRALIGNQTISLTLDNFELISSVQDEVACSDFLLNKEKIYLYNFRHKDMDYALYGKGELPIHLNETDSTFITKKAIPEAPPLQKADTLNLGDVFFDFNKAILKTAAFDMLQNYFGQTTTATTIDSIYVDGHTDSIGSASQNLALSMERCKSIKTWLLQNNITSDARIIIRPFGKTRPIATNATAVGRAMNRRVQIIVVRKRLTLKEWRMEN